MKQSDIDDNTTIQNQASMPDHENDDDDDEINLNHEYCRKKKKKLMKVVENEGI